MVSDFTLINSGVTKWFGAKTKSVEPFLVSDEYVNAFVSGGSQVFNLKSIGNSAVSFKDFNEFRLMDIGKNDLIAIATIPKSSNTNQIYVAKTVNSTVNSASSGKSSDGMMSILFCVLLHALQF